MMGLFAPKMTKQEIEQATRLEQIYSDSIKLVDTTKKPDVFFSRLSLVFDTLLALQKYEKKHFFKGVTPSQRIKNLAEILEREVNQFIMRVSYDELNKISALKTDKARSARIDKFEKTMRSAFASSSTFNMSNNGMPHYTEPFVSSANLEFLESTLLDMRKNLQ